MQVSCGKPPQQSSSIHRICLPPSVSVLQVYHRARQNAAEIIAIRRCAQDATRWRRSAAQHGFYAVSS